MQINCEYTELVDTASLERHPKNANIHSEAQIERLAQLIDYHGFRHPIIVSKRSNFIVAGHGRLDAAQKLKYKQVPVDYQDFESDEAEYAFLVADNAIAAWAELNLASINAEIPNLGPDFDIDLLGIEDFKIDPAENDLGEKELSADQNSALDKAWSQWCAEIIGTLGCLEEKRIFCQSLTPAALKIYFLNSLYAGAEFPRSATTARQYHRMYASGDGDKGGIFDILNKCAEDPKRSKNIRFALMEKPILDKLATTSAPMAGHKAPLDFPAELARDIINEFAANGTVLDPCHGWGGRLIGFLLSKANAYHGVDASDITNNALKQINGDLQEYVAGKEVILHCSPFEDFKVKEGYYDLAFTSPPYFDREHYIGGDQAHTRYDSYEAFINGFYRAFIANSYKALKPGGHFVLQVGNQAYDLDEQAIRIAKELGFKLIAKRNTDMATMHTKEIQEIILIFQKHSP